MLEVKDIEGTEGQLISVNENRLDSSNSSSFKTKVFNVMEGQALTVIIDMSNVDFVDSSGLGALISVLKRRPDENALILCGLSKPVERLFQLTKMDTVFSLTKTSTEAIDKVVKGL